MGAARVAVVGGGICGLLAALHLADAGAHAVLFEATSHAGGRARTREVDGFRLNQGPHALYRGGHLMAALRRFGIGVSGAGPDLAAGFGLWGGEALPFPLPSAGRMPKPLDGEDAQALATFAARVAHEARIGQGRTLTHMTATLPPRSKAVVEALIRLSTYCHAPTLMDAEVALAQLRLSYAGTTYVDGGWQVIAQGLVDAAQRAGVEIRCRKRVTAVEAGRGEIALHARDAPVERFDAAVLAVPPATAGALVPTSAILAARRSATIPVRLVSLDLALSGLPRPDHAFALGIDTPTYLSVHSAVSDLAPHDGAVVHVARYLAPGERPSPQHAREIEDLADALQPGWRDLLVHQQRLAGAIVAHDLPLARSGGRAPHYLDDAPGIFLAGDWIGTEGMLADASAASARVAAAAAVIAAEASRPSARTNAMAAAPA